MSTSIHASIEYLLRHNDESPGVRMSYAEIVPGVSFSNIFEALGVGDTRLRAVPKRGFPRTANGEYVDDMGWIAERELTNLVVVNETYGEDGTEQESDGRCVAGWKAREWIAKGMTEILPEAHNWPIDPTSPYGRIRDPDIHSVNWITADELEKAIAAAGNGYLAGYKAAVAAMRILETEKHIRDVRFVYGFDN